MSPAALRLDDRRQVVEERGPVGPVYSLPGSVARRRRPGKAVIGTYDARERVLFKRARIGEHVYRGRSGGFGFNLELLALLERAKPEPATVRIDVIRGDADPTGPPSYSLPWAVVMAYARAADAGDTRYLVADDVDRQVLVPWEAWHGLEVEPPPFLATRPKASKRRAGAAAPTLFDQ